MRIIEKSVQQNRLLSYIHLKCTIVIFHIVYIGYNFLCDFIKQNTRSAFSQKFWKNCVYKTSLQAILVKNIPLLSFKISILHANFRTIPCNRVRDIIIARILRKTEQKRPLLRYMYLNCIIVIFKDIYFANKFLCSFINQKSILFQKT